MSKQTQLKCEHSQKTHRLVFACKTTGDYSIDLCKNCRDNEPKDFLIEEVNL